MQLINMKLCVIEECLIIRLFINVQILSYQCQQILQPDAEGTAELGMNTAFPSSSAIFSSSTRCIIIKDRTAQMVVRSIDSVEFLYLIVTDLM